MKEPSRGPRGTAARTGEPALGTGNSELGTSRHSLLAWYRDVRVPQLSKLPEARAVRLYRILDDSSGQLGSWLAAWKVHGPIDPRGTSFAEFSHGSAGSENGGAIGAVLTAEHTPRRTPGGLAPAGSAYPQFAPSLYITFNQGAEGMEEAFMDGYLHVHIPELLTAPGMSGATRITVTADTTGLMPSGAAVYEVEGDDPRGVIASLWHMGFSPVRHGDRTKSIRVLAQGMGPA